VVGTDHFIASEAQCLFREGEEFLLPTQLADCSTIVGLTNAELAVSLLSDQDPPLDDSGNDNLIVNNGTAMSTSGASFVGGSYLTVPTFEYASDATFSISMWLAKQQCDGSTRYEYLYSHMEQQTDAWEQDSYALVMFLCEATGALASTLDGSVLRYDVHDTDGIRGTFDFSVHNAGDFDSITSSWIHTVWSVSNAAMASYVDGASPVGSYGWYRPLTVAQNAANPIPARLSPNLGRLNLLTDIYLGGRYDGDVARAFTGSLALVSVYDRMVTADEAACIFHDGEGALRTAALVGRRLLSTSSDSADDK